MYNIKWSILDCFYWHLKVGYINEAGTGGAGTGGGGTSDAGTNETQGTQL